MFYVVDITPRKSKNTKPPKNNKSPSPFNAILFAFHCILKQNDLVLKRSDSHIRTSVQNSIGLISFKWHSNSIPTALSRCPLDPSSSSDNDCKTDDKGTLHKGIARGQLQSWYTLLPLSPEKKQATQIYIPELQIVCDDKTHGLTPARWPLPSTWTPLLIRQRSCDPIGSCSRWSMAWFEKG